MTGMEIVLLILGVLVVIVSFVIPEKKEEADDSAFAAGEDRVREIIDGQMKEAKEKLRDAADETLSYAMEKSERTLERVSNEKITAVSEFSETVLQDIHKNHQEVMFLYDMLHDKQKNLKETVKDADRTSAMAKETKNELETAAKLYHEEIAQETAEAPTADQTAPTSTAGQTISAGGEAASAIGGGLSGKTKNSPADSQAVSADSRTVTAAFPKTGSHAFAEGQELLTASDTDKTDAGTNNNEKILEMHKLGKSNVAIAKELGLGVGEVKLVIDLFEVIEE